MIAHVKLIKLRCLVHIDRTRLRAIFFVLTIKTSSSNVLYKNVGIEKTITGVFGVFLSNEK